MNRGADYCSRFKHWGKYVDTSRPVKRMHPDCHLAHLEAQQCDKHTGGRQDGDGSDNVEHHVANTAWSKASTCEHHTAHQDDDASDQEGALLHKEPTVKGRMGMVEAAQGRGHNGVKGEMQCHHTKHRADSMPHAPHACTYSLKEVLGFWQKCL